MPAYVAGRRVAVEAAIGRAIEGLPEAERHAAREIRAILTDAEFWIVSPILLPSLPLGAALVGAVAAAESRGIRMPDAVALPLLLCFFLAYPALGWLHWTCVARCRVGRAEDALKRVRMPLKIRGRIRRIFRGNRVYRRLLLNLRSSC